MANSDDSTSNQSSAPESNADERLRDDTHDPEFEIPDPEQVERDIQDAEGVYGRDHAKPTGKPDEGKDKVA